MTSVEITPAGTAAQSKIGLTGKTVAIELRDNCLGAMVDGWLAYFDDTRSPVTDDHIGQLCIVALDTGDVLLRTIVRSDGKGGFDLQSDYEPPMIAAKVVWASRIKMVAPKCARA